MIKFVPLHSHSRYSVLDGLSDIEEKLKRAKEIGYNSIALTDHGTVCGIIKFYKLAKKVGIKPIVGSEFYLIEDAEGNGKDRHAHHLVVLAKNNEGWANICRLTTIANSNFYYKPRIDLKALEAHKEGLIVLTACMHGSVSYYLFDKHKKETMPDGQEISLLKEAADIPKAYHFAKRLKEILGDNFYLETQDGGIVEQKVINERVRQMSADLNIPIVATQDDHYVHPDDNQAHAFLKSLAFGAKFAEEGSHGFSTNEFYLKTPDQVAATSLIKEEIERSALIAETCNVDIQLGKAKLPVYPYLPSGSGSLDFLKQLINQGWRSKKIIDKDGVYKARLYKEIKDIELAGIADYFLIVWDIINWAKLQNIYCGSGRGSVGGSLIAYMLGITNIDPIRYNLIWERFYNTGRAGSLPDIDTDFEKGRRGEVLDYIKSRFGNDRVAQIVTISTLGARAVIKDVFRVAGIDFDIANKVSALIPAKNDDHGAISLQEAVDSTPELAKYAHDDNNFDIVLNGKVVRTTSYKKLFDIAFKLEGCIKTYGTHAAAVVISDKPFDEAGIPLVRSSTSEDLICGWDMDDVDTLGLLKVDILGLATLSVIKRCRELIKQRHGIDVDVNNLPLNDAKTFELICNGHNDGIFQLESSLGKGWSKKLKPRSLDEIAELISLIRPACLDSGLTEAYAKIKSGELEPSYLHPLLKSSLEKTRSILIYQEQVMDICQKIAGMDLKQADVLRKAIGKKVPELLRQQKDKFVSGAEKTVGKEIAEQLWSWIEVQAGYSFNSAHAYGYAMLSYQTAWLKANYYIEFLCANLMFAKDKANQFKTSQDVISSFINDGKLHNISVTPPKLSTSEEDFKIIDDHTIAFGFSHIKNVGASALQTIKGCQLAKDFRDFLRLAKESKLNIKTVEALICSGALDDFKHPRRSMKNMYMFLDEFTAKEYQILTNEENIFDAVERICNESLIESRKQAGIFVPNKNRREKIRELLASFKLRDHHDSPAQLLIWEQIFLGISISGNMADLKDNEASHNCIDIAQSKVSINQPITLCVTLDDLREHIIKKGKSAGSVMAFVKISDSSYALENVVLFPKIYEKSKHRIEPGDVVLIGGKVSDKGGVVIDHIKRI